jgi:hypothetical protein
VGIDQGIDQEQGAVLDECRLVRAPEVQVVDAERVLERGEGSRHNGLGTNGKGDENVDRPGGGAFRDEGIGCLFCDGSHGDFIEEPIAGGWVH